MALFAEDQEMKIRNLAAMLLTLSLSMAASQSALAGKPTDPPPPTLTCDLTDEVLHEHGCRVELLDVFYAIGGAMSVSDRDESKLKSKVCAADNKLHIMPTPKTDDAIQKLQNIIDTVNSKAKISEDDAGNISYEAYLAQICIGNL
jgi:hypothetical protein